jgi:FG-GAP repeat
VLVAAPFADFNGRTNSGSAYVIYGRTSTTTVDVASLGSAGFRIDGPATRDTGFIKQVGMAAAGNVGGDARDDVIVSFRMVSPPDGAHPPGTSFVIYGGASGTVDTAALGTAGFTIANSGGAVAGLRDFNGDGRNDLALGRAFAGDGHVVFGVSPPVDRDVDALGNGGFSITDTYPSTQFPVSYSVGWTLDGGADVNGDGRPDLVLGDHQPGCFSTCTLPRRAGLLFGGPSTAGVDVASLGSRGFRIDGTQSQVEPLVALAGDVNGDVRSDVLVGRGPAAALVYGKAGTGAVNLDQLGDAGVVLTGVEVDFSYPFDGVGDQDGDLISDVAVEDDPSDRVYVVSLLPGAAQQLASWPSASPASA